MEIVLSSLVLLIFTACPVRSADVCGNAPNGKSICLTRTTIKRDAAKLACEGMQEQLVTILDQPTQDFIVNSVLDSLVVDRFNNYWIGIFRNGVYEWETSGATVGPYDNWDPGSAYVNDCVMLQTFNGFWRDTLCTGDLHGYLCETVGGAATTMSSNVETTTEGKTTKVETTTEGKTTKVETTTEGKTTNVETTTEGKTTNVETTTEGKTTKVETTTEGKTTKVETTTEGKTTKVETTTEEITTNVETTTEGITTNIDTTTEEQTTTLTTTPPSTTQRQSTAMSTTTSSNGFTTVKKPTTVETTTSTSLASSTTVKEATTEPLKTTRAVTTMDNRLTTLQTTPVASLPPVTTAQQFTSSKIPATTNEGTQSPTAGQSSSKTKPVTTRPAFTTTVDETTTFSVTQTTKEKSTSKVTVEKTTAEATTTILPVTSTEETTISETTTELSTARTITNETPVNTETTTVSAPPTTSPDVTTTQALPIATSQTDLIQSTQTSTPVPNSASTTGETSAQTNNSTTSSVSEQSTGACNGRCELTLEERLANATLYEVSSIVANEDLDGEDILLIQGWFEVYTYIEEYEKNYIRYITVYLHTVNEIIISTKVDTFAYAHPAVFANSCNEVLEDFTYKSSFNDTLEISFSSIDAALLRQPVDTFEGFTSNFNNEEQLGGYISIEDDWVEDYNITDNSTMELIVVLYEAPRIGDLGNDNTTEIVSSFVSITVLVNGEPISVPVTYGLELDERILKAEEAGKIVVLEPLCVFWDYSFYNDSSGYLPNDTAGYLNNNYIGYWNTFGCGVISQNETFVQCRCNHTTNFAVLMQITKVEISPEDEAALSWLSLIGLLISTIALLITLIVLVCLRSLKSDRVFIHKNLVVALIIAQAFFISTIVAVHQELVCKLVAISLHYFYLTVFMWMLVEGVHLYLEIVQVFSRFDGKVTTVHYVVAGWGLPLIVVGVSVAIRWKNYGVGQRCWLSIDDGLIWAFVGPVTFVIVTNFIILIMVIRVVFRASSERGKDEKEYKHLLAALKGALFLLPLLGLSWAIGFMSISESTIVFQYLFVILNSLQGLFIFLIYCAFNKEVRNALSRRFSQVALTSGGSKSRTLKTVLRLNSAGKTSLVKRFSDNSSTSGVPSKSSGKHTEDDGKRPCITPSAISVHQKEQDSQSINTKNEESKSPFSPDYD